VVKRIGGACFLAGSLANKKHVHLINRQSLITQKPQQINALVAKTQHDKVVRWCADGEFLEIFASLFSASRVQHISHLHSKIALRPHHV